jgi:SAM-dependent methyltransferase
MSRVIPSAEEVLRAWAARVRANREQVEQFRETSPGDFYAPIAGMFRADPRRTDDPALNVLRALVQASDVVLDVGAGGGRLALPLALETREVIALDSSPGMLDVLREGMLEHGIDNVRVVQGRWPGGADDLQADVGLLSQIGYDIEDIGPFLDALEASTRRLCVAILLDRPPPAEADRVWPMIHGVERAALPALPEFLTLLLARGKLFEVQLVERAAQSYPSLDVLRAWLRGQLWTEPDGAKDRQLQRLLAERVETRDDRLALSWEPVRLGIVTWH